MSLHRVRTMLREKLAKHEKGARDGHEPTAEAHRVFVAHVNEDLAAVEGAIEGERVIEKSLRAEVDSLRAQLAALEEAAGHIATIAVIPYNDKGNAALAAYDDAIRNAEAAAREHEARVRAVAVADVVRAVSHRGDAVLVTPSDIQPALDAVDAHHERVRAKALREAAEAWRTRPSAAKGPPGIYDWLRALADEAEKGADRG